MFWKFKVFIFHKIQLKVICISYATILGRVQNKRYVTFIYAPKSIFAYNFENASGIFCVETRNSSTQKLVSNGWALVFCFFAFSLKFQIKCLRKLLIKSGSFEIQISLLSSFLSVAFWKTNNLLLLILLKPDRLCFLFCIKVCSMVNWSGVIGTFDLIKQRLMNRKL